MRTLKLTISYDGTRFVGWQRQAEGVSIQGLLEEALARFEGAPVAVHGAGRTDAGVHALGQVASARVTSAHPTGALARGLNACLPQDVRVVGVQEAAADFHARFSARSKTYRYLLRNAPIVSFVWSVGLMEILRRLPKRSLIVGLPPATSCTRGDSMMSALNSHHAACLCCLRIAKERPRARWKRSRPVDQ